MRKNISTKKLLLGSLALLYSGVAVQAKVVWHDSHTPNLDGSDPVLEIQSNSILTSMHDHHYVSITASKRPINVYLTQKTDPTIISRSKQVDTLFLEPKNANITFHVTQDLKFVGASAEDGGHPLFIAVRGGHKVIFRTNGRKSITLEPNGLNGGSVKLYVIMDGTILEFNRASAHLEDNIFINLGYRAALGYASDKALSDEGVGIIQFNPTNLDKGRMALAIDNKASVLISGRTIKNHRAESYDLVYADIEKTCPAGCQAIFGIINSNPDASSRLLVLNANKTLAHHQIWHPKTYLGKTYGFVLGCNGKLSLGTLTFLAYVGLSLDQCLKGSEHMPCGIDSVIDGCLCENCAGLSHESLSNVPFERIFKKRNPSALIVDGYNDKAALPACIDLAAQSAVVFLSGVDCEGKIENDLTSEFPFTVSPSKRTPGAGNMLLDVEGCLTVAGAGTDPIAHPTKLEILSLFSTPTGATVLIDGTGSKNFPARTFAKHDGAYRAYNSGYFFFNNNAILYKTFLVHTDQNHKVCDNDDLRSEPTYVGGEINKLTGKARPRVIFSDSTLMVHTSLALTGVDLLVPNALECCLPCEEQELSAEKAKCIDCKQMYTYPCHRAHHFAHMHQAIEADKEKSDDDLVNAKPCDNLSKFTFFYNGYAKDNGTGRQMILGTYPGSTTCDCCNVVNQDSHLDIMQLADQSCTCSNIHELVLNVAPNNSTIIEGVPADITGQFSINTIFLGHASNTSVGSPTGQVPEHFSCPTLTIDGNYFSFNSRGGIINYPQASNICGQGGIFVDNNGTIRAINTCGVNMGVMVTKSGNGVIDLPGPIVRFGYGLGEADWKLDLSKTPVIIPAGSVLSDYVLNWNTICKDPNFLPFICTCTACPANAAAVANVTGLPTVLGEVDQLFIRGSRIGDPAHIKVGNGGNVRELIFPDACQQGFAPTAVIVLENDGKVGLGSAHTNVDSLAASVVMGNNGITIIANGDSRVLLNEDIVINNVCHIVQGPNWASSNRLLIESDCCRTILVKSSGVLDLTSFTVNGVVVIGGNVKLVLEPGAKIILGTVELKFSENAGIFSEPVSKTLLPTTKPTDLTALDALRAKFIGSTGIVRFTGCSYFIIPEGAFVGVETMPNCSINTNLNFILEDSAHWSIGQCSLIGGAFQVGNTSDQGTGASINFSLQINGNDAEFYIGQGAFVGLGSAIAYKLYGSVPNEWLIGQTYNVQSISINVLNGVFSHNIIWDGNRSSEQFSLVGSAMAIGGGSSTPTFTIDFSGDTDGRTANLSRSAIRGGGNLFLTSTTTPTGMNIQNLNTSTVGILSSDPLFRLPLDRQLSGSASVVFNDWRNADILGSASQYNSRCDVGPFIRNEMMAGYVDRGFIQRLVQIAIIGSAGTTTDQSHSIDIGAAAIRLVPSTNPNQPRAIQNMSILA